MPIVDDGFCLLDTSYSKIQTDFKNPLHNVKFIPVGEVDKKNVKNTNLECYTYFNDVYLPKLANDWLNNEMCDIYDIGKRDLALGIYPIEVYEKYNNALEMLENNGLMFFAEKQFLKWYKRIKKKSRYILLRNGEKKALKKIICRFDKKYAKMINNRMNCLMYQYGNENACSVTLTLNPANFRNSKMAMWTCINILLNEFMTELKRYLKNNGTDVKYIRCIEAMKGRKENEYVGRGNPHIHICLFGVKWIPKEIIDKLWPYGWTFINSTAKGQKVRYPIHYVTKYITKTYNENDVNNTLNQSLVWFFNKNSFDHSVNLVYPLYKKGSGSWVCEYLVEMDPLDDVFKEMDLIFEVEENLYKKPPPGDIVC